MPTLHLLLFALSVFSVSFFWRQISLSFNQFLRCILGYTDCSSPALLFSCRLSILTLYFRECAVHLCPSVLFVFSVFLLLSFLVFTVFLHCIFILSPPPPPYFGVYTLCFYFGSFFCIFLFIPPYFFTVVFLYFLPRILGVCRAELFEFFNVIGSFTKK